MRDKDWNDFLVGQATGYTGASQYGQLGASVYKSKNRPPPQPNARARPGKAKQARALPGKSKPGGISRLLLFAVIGYVGYLFSQGWFTDARVASFGDWVRNAIHFGVLPAIGLILIIYSWLFSDRTARGALRWVFTTALFALLSSILVASGLDWLRDAAQIPPVDIFSFTALGGFTLILIAVPAAIITLLVTESLRSSFGARARPWQMFLLFDARRRAKLRNDLESLIHDVRGRRIKPSTFRDTYLANVIYSFIYWRASAYFRYAKNDRLEKITLSEYKRASRSVGGSGDAPPACDSEAPGRHGAFLAAALANAGYYCHPRFPKEFAKAINDHIKAASETISAYRNTPAYHKAVLDRFWFRSLERLTSSNVTSDTRTRG